MTDISFLDVHEATPEDAQAIHDLMVTAQMGVPDKSMYVIQSPNLIRYELASPLRFGYLAEADGEAISFALFSMGEGGIPDAARHFHDVVSEGDVSSKPLRCGPAATRPGFRMYGIASQLLHLGLGRGVSEGCRSAWATVDPRNVAAIRLLEGIDFSVCGTRGFMQETSKDYVMEPLAGDDDSRSRRAIVRHVLCKGI